MKLSPLEQLQSDIVGIISSSPFFSTVTILREDTGVTENDAAQALSVATVQGGKIGAFILIFQSEEETAKEDAPGPEDNVTTLIRAIEMPETNRSAEGAGITARAMATQIRRLLHLVSRGPTALRAKRARRYQDGEGAIGFDIEILTVVNLPAIRRVPQPQISGARSAVTIACNLSGAALWYTTDGTYPANGAGTSAQYAGSLNLPANTLLRAVAYPPAGSHWEASGITEAFIK